MTSNISETQEPSIDTDKLSYEIFSILESKFLFGYEDNKLWIPKQISPSPEQTSQTTTTTSPTTLVSNTPLQSVKNQRGKICVLSIDGGGMRNILPGKALDFLEQSLQKFSGDTSARIADYFDVGTGSGVGGIFTAMMFATQDGEKPVFKAEDTWKLLEEKGRKLYRRKNEGVWRRVFGGKDGTGEMEECVKCLFKGLTLRDTLKPVLIPCYDMMSNAPFLFSRADALETLGYDFRLWEVCRATSSDPGLFRPVCMESVDGVTKCVGVGGGLAMSNPTAAAITHVLHNKEEFPFVRGLEDILVLSLGVGEGVEGRCGFDEVKGWGAKEWVRMVGRISGDGAADVVDQSLALAFGSNRSRNYLRIQANGSSLARCGANVDSDSSPHNVKMLTEIADEMLKQKNVESVLFGGKRIGEQSNFEKLEWFARELVLEHQRRSCRIAPTVAFKQANHKIT